MNKETKCAEYAAVMDCESLHNARNISPYVDTIAVVGGGAAATSFVYHFGISVTPKQAQKTYILLFEPRDTIGPGLAYQEDVEALLLNRSSDGMSASAEEPSTFSSWLRWKAHHAEDLRTLSDSDPTATFASVFHQRGREGRIEIELPSGARRAYDHVVNATGAARWVDAPEDAPLAWRLLRDGLASRDARGGLRVDFATNALIDATGRPDANLLLLGHLTCGTHLFVTSLEMIARRARMIALDMGRGACRRLPR